MLTTGSWYNICLLQQWRDGTYTLQWFHFPCLSLKTAPGFSCVLLSYWMGGFHRCICQTLSEHRTRSCLVFVYWLPQITLHLITMKTKFQTWVWSKVHVHVLIKRPTCPFILEIRSPQNLCNGQKKALSLKIHLCACTFAFCIVQFLLRNSL